MNEQQQYNPGSMELPKPQTDEKGVDSLEHLTGVPESDATSSARIEQGVKPSVSAQAPLLDDQAQNSPQATHQADDSVTSTAGTQDLIADETDLIEKEWVIKAKHIVEQTKDDPHLQSKEIVKVKADYLKKRYNKEIKVAED